MPDLWAGRLPGGPDPHARRFTGTVSEDWRLAPYDIRGSLAHVAMLEGVGLVTQEEAASLRDGLSNLLSEVDAGCPPWNPAAEDVHSAVEEALTARIGSVGGKLHTGRSRNDQVALDVHLYVIDAARDVAGRLDGFIRALADRAEEYAPLAMPGYTHLQRAQPITVGHHLLAHAAMALRDRERLGTVAVRASRSPLGAGALATSTLRLNPELSRQTLGLDALYQNSLDAVADRDFVVEFVFSVAMIGSHLSRFAEEVVLWTSQEFGFAAIADAWATGSSIMPQKKNPDVAELLRGRAARSVSQLVGLLTLLKGLPMAYNRDLQEDKRYLFDAHDTASLCLDAAAGLMRALSFRPDRLADALTRDLLATDDADRLVENGMPFREAHGVVAQSRDWTSGDAASAEEVRESLARRDGPMGPGPMSLDAQITYVREMLSHPL